MAQGSRGAWLCRQDRCRGLFQQGLLVLDRGGQWGQSMGRQMDFEKLGCCSWVMSCDWAGQGRAAPGQPAWLALLQGEAGHLWDEPVSQRSLILLPTLPPNPSGPQFPSCHTSSIFLSANTVWHRACPRAHLRKATLGMLQPIRPAGSCRCWKADYLFSPS